MPAQDSEFLTSLQGQRLQQTDDSLKAGARGPTLMEDFHLREKITHFDHERIPERVVHARGAAAHGVFESYGTATEITAADFLKPGRTTPVFTRFSTVVGSRGSADTVRDVRGFAVKFYTGEGVFDLVGNNIPVFFIRDGIKFPDLIHAAKPEPDREIPQAQTAHATFWDFVSLLPESPHMLMWAMSDRAIPRSYRMMEGFGVHTFRLVNAAGETSLVKFHWKPVLGVHGLVWDEALTLNGVDPDFHRRDLYNAIGADAFPEWELGVQVMPDSEDQTFRGIDLLDSTKLVPEELVPVQPIGRMTLNRCPSNFFAEVEQVAYHVGHLVRGIEVVDDPLMQARLFSYLDTQLTRLGGPNFAQLPINRPHAPVNDNLRDGFGQQAVHHGRAPYLPNSVDGGCPFLADVADGGYVHTARPVQREQGPSTWPERRVRPSDAVLEQHDRSRAGPHRRRVHVRARQGGGPGGGRTHGHPAGASRRRSRPARLRRPRSPGADSGRPGSRAAAVERRSRNGRRRALDSTGGLDSAPSLSMVTENAYPVDGRVVHILANDGCDLAGVRAVQEAVMAAGAVAHVIATHKGAITGRGRSRDELVVDRSFHTASSAEADALVIADGANLADDPDRDHLRAERASPLQGHRGMGRRRRVAHQRRHRRRLPGCPRRPRRPRRSSSEVLSGLGRHRRWDRAATHPTRRSREEEV